MTRGVQRDRTADAEVGPQQRLAQSHRRPAVDPYRERGIDRHTRQRRMHGRSGLSPPVCRQQQWGQRRRGRDDGVTQRPGDLEAGAIASGLRQRLSAGCDDDASRGDDSVIRRRGQVLAAADDRGDTPWPLPLDAADAGLPEQRVEHVSSAVGIGKQLAVVLLVERHTGGCEEPHRVVDRQRPQHASNDRGRSAPIVALGHDSIGDVAASAPADQDLRAGHLRAVDEQDVKRGVAPAREDRGGQAGRPGPDDQHITCRFAHASPRYRGCAIITPSVRRLSLQGVAANG